MAAETSFARARRVALAGLLLQALTYAVVVVLAGATRSAATAGLAWYMLCGVPIWFVALLIFRQHELAELERMDLEELRRERATTGGTESIFGESANVAANRLAWMQRWFPPAFSLITAALLAFSGASGWFWVQRQSASWPKIARAEIGMLVLALLMLLQFLFSRYAAGMSRTPGWQFLRACASFMLGNAVVCLALIVCLGVWLYAGIDVWEHVIARIVMVLMVVLGAEVLLNFLLDIYRPRSPGVEPRAAFDSRILGLISEPGGIAHSLAEALNYQFGFQVSHTWFYQLLSRAFVPMVGFGALVLWALTCVVVVQPYELGIIERFGRQVNAEQPLPPGLHFKWPWPFEVAEKYNTRQLHQMFLGRKMDADAEQQESEGDKPTVVQWTDQKHGGFEEFNFLVSPTPGSLPPAASQSSDMAQAGAESGVRQAVHILRMTVALQYQILPARLKEFSGHVTDPPALLRYIAWQELVRYNASNDTRSLLGAKRDKAGAELRQKINDRLTRLDIGLEVIYVGLQDVHPEKTVADAYRKVIGAEQEKITAIRQALVIENRQLSAVAGDKNRALLLAAAIAALTSAEESLNRADIKLEGARVPADLQQKLDELTTLSRAQIEAQWSVQRFGQQFQRIQDDIDLGLGASLSQKQRAAQLLAQAEADQKAAAEKLEAGIAPVRAAAVSAVGAEKVAPLLDRTHGRVAVEFWNRRLEELLKGLEGDAAVMLAQAQANRWEVEMTAEAEVASLRGERIAYQASPDVYRARVFLQALVEGVAKSRKYLMAFDPKGRPVRVRIEAEEQTRFDPGSMPTRVESNP